MLMFNAPFASALNCFLYSLHLYKPLHTLHFFLFFCNPFLYLHFLLYIPSYVLLSSYALIPISRVGVCGLLCSYHCKKRLRLEIPILATEHGHGARRPIRTGALHKAEDQAHKGRHIEHIRRGRGRQRQAVQPQQVRLRACLTVRCSRMSMRLCRQRLWRCRRYYYQNNLARCRSAATS